MKVQTLENIFERAFAHCFSKKKLLIVFSVLCMNALIFLLFWQGTSQLGGLFSFNLFLALFLLSTSLFISLGTFLVRLYHHELKGIQVDYKKIWKNSYAVLIAPLYVLGPVLLLLILIFFLEAAFYFLLNVPLIGELFQVIFSFLPFLLILTSLVLSLFCPLFSFLLAPVLALKYKGTKIMYSQLLFRLKNGITPSLFLCFLACIPFLLTGLVLLPAMYWTDLAFLNISSVLPLFFQRLTLLIPIAALLTLPTIFFFNLSCEALRQSKMSEGS